MATYAQAKAMLRRYSRKLLAYKNVVAVGLGRKNGDLTRKGWCIKVQVTKKTKSRTKASIPEILKPPRGYKSLVPIETDVKQVGEIRLHLDVQVSSHLAMSGEYGTCGGIFTMPDGYYALTCGHVASMELAGLHNLPKGVLPVSQYIPCNLTNANASSIFGIIGQCVRCSSDRKPVDLALVLLDSTNSNPEGHPRLRGFRKLSDSPLQVGETLTVLRYAGDFDVTMTGDDDHYVTTSFDYPTSQGTKRVIYDGLICYPSNNAPDSLIEGDSGSCVVDSQNNLVGIHIGASSKTGYAVSCDQLLDWAGPLTIVQAPQ